MRTYILSMFDKRTKKSTQFRCQAPTFDEAVTMAQKALAGIPGLPLGNAKEAGDVSVNA